MKLIDLLTQLYKTKQFFFVLIKISLVVASFFFIYKKLVGNSALAFYDFVQFLNKTNAFWLKSIIFLILLTLFNWFFEILKWQTLVSSIKLISFKRAIEQCLGSLTISLFTPNRIGEYGAKALYFEKTLRKRVVFLNLINNLIQMAITLFFGFIGIILFANKYNLKVNSNTFVFLLIGIGIILIVIFILKKTNFQIKGFSLNKIKMALLNIKSETIVLGFLFSFFRYLLFSFQFFYLLTFFNIEISYFNAMIIITSMYLLVSVIPSISFFDVAIKGSIAVYLFSLISVNEIIILSIVTIMWILNFVLPSIVGSYFVLSYKYPTNNN
jgi:hypothetical protein